MIEVRDDGRGIDPAKVARKAAERGLIAADAIDTIDCAKAVELLFAPGFSTAETSRATSPAAASAWTRCAPRSASSAARS